MTAPLETPQRESVDLNESKTDPRMKCFGPEITWTVTGRPRDYWARLTAARTLQLRPCVVGSQAGNSAMQLRMLRRKARVYVAHARPPVLRLVPVTGLLSAVPLQLQSQINYSR